ncbi:unnamed protein product [[Candida] boidinii]|nr:unnamed protein product [[Candida] boidinii]
MNRSSSFPIQQKPQVREYTIRNDESSQIPQKEEESDNNNNNNNSKDDLDKTDSHSSSESNSNERYLSSFPPPSTQILKMDNTNRFEYLYCLNNSITQDDLIKLASLFHWSLSSTHINYLKIFITKIHMNALPFTTSFLHNSFINCFLAQAKNSPHLLFALLAIAARYECYKVKRESLISSLNKSEFEKIENEKQNSSKLPEMGEDNGDIKTSAAVTPTVTPSSTPSAPTSATLTTSTATATPTTAPTSATTATKTKPSTLTLPVDMVLRYGNPGWFNCSCWWFNP